MVLKFNGQVFQEGSRVEVKDGTIEIYDGLWSLDSLKFNTDRPLRIEVKGNVQYINSRIAVVYGNIDNAISEEVVCEGKLIRTDSNQIKVSEDIKIGGRAPKRYNNKNRESKEYNGKYQVLHIEGDIDNIVLDTSNSDNYIEIKGTVDLVRAHKIYCKGVIKYAKTKMAYTSGRKIAWKL